MDRRTAQTLRELAQARAQEAADRKVPHQVESFVCLACGCRYRSMAPMGVIPDVRQCPECREMASVLDEDQEVSVNWQ